MRKVALFAAALVAVLAAGVGLGAAVGPDVEPAEAEAPAPEGDGVLAAVDGYRLVPVDTALDPDGGRFEFAVVDEDGEPQTSYTELHERDLHLIVVSRDLATFHHVHPRLDEEGTWGVDLPALPAGSYRAIADFQIDGGPRLALGTDLSVAGELDPAPLGEPARTAEVDGYEVTLDAEPAGDGGHGGEVLVTLTVRRGGEVVEPEPYLGASGHLVALRAGDLAYAHVHPEDGHFAAALPSAGRYGLFFDFEHDGEVRTASFQYEAAG
jgi:hypothetical protein